MLCNTLIELIHIGVFVPPIAVFFAISGRKRCEWAKYNVLLLTLIAAGLLFRGRCHLASLSHKLKKKPHDEKPRFIVPFMRQRCLVPLGINGVTDRDIIVANRVVFALAFVVSLQLARDMDFACPRSDAAKLYAAFIALCIALFMVDVSWEPSYSSVGSHPLNHEED